MEIDESKLNQDQKEQAFVDRLVDSVYPGNKAVKIEGHGKPDFKIESRNVVIEVKELIAQEELEKSVVWSNSHQKVKDEIYKLNIPPQLNGVYSITSDYFKATSKKQSRKVAKSIFTAMVQGQSECRDSYRFKIRKVEESLSLEMMFGAVGGVGFRNSSNDLAALLWKNLEKADKQLGSFNTGVANQKNIAFLINRFPWASGLSDMSDACSTDIAKLLSYENIDEVWFCSFFNGQLTKPQNILDSETRGFLEKSSQNITYDKIKPWIRGITSNHQDLNAHLYDFVLDHLSDLTDIADDWAIRADLVDLCNWALANYDYQSILPLVEALQGFMDHFESDPEESWVDQYSIRVAFLVQRLCCKSEFRSNALELTKKLFEYENETILNNALISLTELTCRWELLDAADRDILKGLILNESEKLISSDIYHERLSHLLCYCRWLDTAESLSLLELFGGNQEFAKVEVVFALGQMADSFDYDPAMRILSDKLKPSTSESAYQNALADAILRRLAEDELKDKDNLGEYTLRLESCVDLLMDLPYRSGVHNAATYWIDQYSVLNLEKSVAWTLSLLDIFGGDVEYRPALYLENIASRSSDAQKCKLRLKLDNLDRDRFYIVGDDF